MTDTWATPDGMIPERLIQERLIDIGKTLGLAESCTGGRIADMLTQIPGASGYFQGSMVCYQNRVKVELLGVPKEMIRLHHVVSEPVAIEMAAGARRVLKTDFGFGITGVLGPDGLDGLPAGRVCMAMTDGLQTDAVTCQFHEGRSANKEAAARAALLLIWKFVKDKQWLS